MKKSLIALAVLAASGAAMAQSSVTLFGVVDAAVSHVSATNSVSGLTPSGNSSSRLGFRGVEDLGGGLSAGFWLEGGLSNDDGSGKAGGATGPGFEFKRRSTISLMGSFGEIRLGREHKIGYDKPSSYDPFGQVGLGQAAGFANGDRTNNGISYRTPGNLGGFFGQAHYAFGETAGDNSANSYVALAGGFENGPLSVTVAGDQLKDSAVVAPGAIAGTTLKTFSVGASYDLGMVKPSFIYHNVKQGDAKYNLMMLGLTAPVGPGNLVASYSRYDVKNSNADSDQISVGYVYALSKRTAVYGTYAHLNNKNASARSLSTSGMGSVTVNRGENVDGYQVGIRHSF